MAETGYAGFISYSHRDKAAAEWLHKALERYRIPRGIAPGEGVHSVIGGRRLGSFFRDIEELPAGYPLTDKINAALARSRNLIVVCSPDAAQSEYVQKEVVEFQRLFHGKRIFPVIARGGPRGSIFPSAIPVHREILDADISGTEAERAHGVSKLVAGMLGVDTNDLVRREAKQRKRRMVQVGLFAALLFVLLVGALWFAKSAYDSERRAYDEANLQLAVAGWQALEGGRVEQAMRYAMAGHQLSPTNDAHYYALLQAAVAAYGDRIATFSKATNPAAKDGFASITSAGDAFLLGGFHQDDREARSALLTPGKRPALLPIAGATVWTPAPSRDAMLVTVQQRTRPLRLTVRDARSGRVKCTANLPGEYINSHGFTPDSARIAAASTAGLFLIDSAQCGVTHSMTARGMDTIPTIVAVTADATFVKVSEALKRVPHDNAKTTTMVVPAGTTYGSVLGDFVVLDGDFGGKTARILDLRNVRETTLRVPTGVIPQDPALDTSQVHDVTLAAGGAAVGTAFTGKFLFGRDQRFLRRISDNSNDTVVASPDGSRFAVLSQGGTVIWSVEAPDKPVALHGAAVAGLNDFRESTFNADGSMFVSQRGGAIIAWDTATGRVRAIYRHATGELLKLSFAGNGGRLAGLGRDGVILWDTAALGRVAGTTDFALERGRVTSFSGNRLVTALSPHDAGLWAYPERRLLTRLPGGAGMPWRVVFGPDSQRAVVLFREDVPYAPVIPSTTSQLPTPNGVAYLVDTARGRILSRLPGHSGRLYDAAFSPDSHTLGTLGLDGKLQLWDARSGARASEYQILSAVNPGIGVPSRPAISFSADSRFVGIESTDGLTDTFAAIDLVAKRIVARGQGGTISPASTRALIWLPPPDQSTRAFRIIDLTTGKTLVEHVFRSSEISTIEASPDLRHVLFGGILKQPNLLAADGGGTPQPLRNATGILAAAFSEDSKWVAIENDAGVGVWEVETQQLLARFDTGSGRISSLALGGGRLAFVSGNGTAHLFDVRSRRQLLAVGDDASASAYLTPTSFHVLLTQPKRTEALPSASASFAFGSTRFLDFTRALSSWAQLAKHACAVIGVDQQVFSNRERDADPVLAANWRSGRNVCAR